MLEPVASVDSDPAPIPLFGPRFLNDPRGLYREMRRGHGAVVPVELPGGLPAWLVIGYRELHQVTSDPELYPRDAALWNQWPNVPPDWPLLPILPISPSPALADNTHRAQQANLDAALETMDAFALRRDCEELSDRLIDSFCGRGTADLVGAFAEPLPVLALARLIGLPDAEGLELLRSMEVIGDAGADSMQAYGRLAESMRQLIIHKRDRPGPDLATALLQQGTYTEEACGLTLMSVLFAGHITTADWLVHSMRLMLTDDRFASAFGGGRRSIGQAMNEVLWEETPTQILAGRWAARDTRLGDKVIRAGDMLLLGLAAANSDPEVRQYTGVEPSSIGNSAHFAFGHGEYRCPYGAQQMAETIARTGIEVLLDRLPDIDLAVEPETLVRRPSPFLSGMTSLPVRFTAVRPLSG
ncbi:cytochrome P450 family protein [Nocardia aurantia]|uniref:cytochrome P450 n=1 Tax=Nocardia aurantia TaxID=2585199 RepID=UPI0029E7F2EC|nr:cytochrome P450 [Nocardia aurantia]